MFDIEPIVNDLVEQKFSVIEKIFDEDLLLSLHDEILQCEKHNNLKNAGIGRQDDYVLLKEVRRNKIDWLNNETMAQNLLFKYLDNLKTELNKNLMLGLFNFESHFAVYNQGDFYKKHFDSFKGMRNRVISLVIYLNKEWQENDGGVFNIYNNVDDQQPIFSLLPKWGRAILFLSEEIPHEVTISNKTRYSIAAWFKVREII